ncbi:MAG: hypothetical protein H6739_40155 [Alphaproteobacteria bacterium]|nr:hypothetical protein [Alphaproteobacteria bacterium]
MIALLLLACAADDGDPTTVSDDAAAYVGPAGAEYAYTRLDAVDDDPLLMRISEDGAAWTFRLGGRWADAEDRGAYAVALDDGLWLDGAQLLPDRLREGASGEGCTVTALDAAEVWYGTFPRVATVEVEGGAWAGAHRFALDIGPIALTMEGTLWELASYELPLE